MGSYGDASVAALVLLHTSRPRTRSRVTRLLRTLHNSSSHGGDALNACHTARGVRCVERLGTPPREPLASRLTVIPTRSNAVAHAFAIATRLKPPFSTPCARTPHARPYESRARPRIVTPRAIHQRSCPPQNESIHARDRARDRARAAPRDRSMLGRASNAVAASRADTARSARARICGAGRDVAQTRANYSINAI